MLTEAYIEALLVDEELADQVWQAWNNGKSDDEMACISWMLNAPQGVGHGKEDQAGKEVHE